VEARGRYVGLLVEDLKRRGLSPLPSGESHTIYFGGGTPALCELDPLVKALGTDDDDEFTVELNPLDVTDDLVRRLSDGGVNRISMGVESLDDRILEAMGRGYTLNFAAERFAIIRRKIPNCGIDLIVGYPGESDESFARLGELGDWGLRHCSVYSLILEEKSILGSKVARGAIDRTLLPSDDVALDRVREMSEALSRLGLVRYEISNYAVPGFECRHNFSVWRGEDYLGFGEGASGREGLTRTLGVSDGKGGYRYEIENVDAERDIRERALFRLRTSEGIDTAVFSEWRNPLDRFAAEGLVTKDGLVYRLTSRGTEVCDSILSELV